MKKETASIVTKVTDESLDVTCALKHVQAPECGGVAIFLGTVRNENEGKRVSAIEYTAFVEMAEKELEKIAKEASARWPGIRSYLVHRIGRLLVGEASVIIAVSAPHRAEAFEACRYMIETLKKTVPIWKKELCD
jgi:molybdopterin synthase catalytic subunit